MNAPEPIELAIDAIDMRESVIFGTLQGAGDDALIKLAEALATAQGTFDVPLENCTGHIVPRDPTKAPFSFKYADMASLLAATRPALAANGFSVTSMPVVVRGEQHVRTVLLHKAGGFIQGEVPIPRILDGAIGQIMQAYGGVIQYSRRYLYKAMLNLAESESLPPEDGLGEATGSLTKMKRHPDIEKATTIAELTAVMSRLPLSSKREYADHYNARQQQIARGLGDTGPAGDSEAGQA